MGNFNCLKFSLVLVCIADTLPDSFVGNTCSGITSINFNNLLEKGKSKIYSNEGMEKENRAASPF